MKRCLYQFVNELTKKINIFCIVEYNSKSDRKGPIYGII